MIVEDYVRNAVVLNVVDGDTLDLNIDLGFRIWIRQRVRVYGIDCPEMHGPSKAAGLAAKSAALGWVKTMSLDGIQVRTHLDKTDSFGRVLAEVWSGDDSLAAYLLSQGYAVPYTEDKVIK